MTIAALQLKNSPSKNSGYRVSGIGAIITLYAPTFTDLPLTVSLLSINRSESNYTVINVPVDDDTLADILAIAGTARIKLNILLFTQESKTFVGSNFDLDLSDFRYDRGVNSINVSIVSRSPINIPASAQSAVLTYQSKQKLSSPNTRYLYLVSPFDYLKYSIGSVVTDGALTGTIISTKLNLSGGQPPSLSIEVLPV